MSSRFALIALAACALAALDCAGASAKVDAWADVPLAQRPVAGTPNIGGVWQMPRRIVALKTVDGREPPLLPAAKAQYARNIAALKADPGADPISGCLMHGLPRLLYAPYPVLISQERDRINFVHEANHTFRIVTLTKPLPKVDEDLDPQWLGHSAGRWEGRTLVIDTVGFNDKTWLDYSGLPHSDQLRIQERYKLAGHDRIKGEITITDPRTFAAPWTTSFVLTRKPNYDLKESVCARDHRM